MAGQFMVTMQRFAVLYASYCKSLQVKFVFHIYVHCQKWSYFWQMHQVLYLSTHPIM